MTGQYDVIVVGAEAGRLSAASLRGEGKIPGPRPGKGENGRTDCHYIEESSIIRRGEDERRRADGTDEKTGGSALAQEFAMAEIGDRSGRGDQDSEPTKGSTDSRHRSVKWEPIPKAGLCGRAGISGARRCLLCYL